MHYLSREGINPFENLQKDKRERYEIRYEPVFHLANLFARTSKKRM